MKTLAWLDELMCCYHCTAALSHLSQAGKLKRPMAMNIISHIHHRVRSYLSASLVLNTDRKQRRTVQTHTHYWQFIPQA